MLDADGVGYCSDITRCVHLGEPPAELAEAYAVLLDAQQAAVAAAVVGTSCEEVDATARRVIAAAGWGDRSSSTAPATASASRSTRTRTSSPGNATAARGRPRLLDRAGHLRARSLRVPPRGHRGGRRRRPRPAQPGRPRPRPPLSPDAPPRDPPRRRHRPAAVGHRRPAVLLGDHAGPHGRASATAGCCAAPTASSRWARRSSACATAHRVPVREASSIGVVRWPRARGARRVGACGARRGWPASASTSSRPTPASRR